MDIQWKSTMKAQINELISEAKDTSQGPDAYGYLPGIIKSLETMQAEFDKKDSDSRKLLKWAGGLGRVVTDSYSFSESPLGTKLLDLVSTIVSRYDST